MQRLRLALTTKRGLGKFAVHALAMFGGVSGLFQFYSAVFVPDGALPGAWWVTVVVIVLSVSWGLARALPKQRLKVALKNPDIEITITVADLFTLDSNIIVGFCDTFDTDTTRDVIISRQSVQGQLLQRFYGEDYAKLDREIAEALDGVAAPMSSETSITKPQGKLERYPIGTIAQLKHGQNTVFAVAYTMMGNDLRAQATVDGLWHSLGEVWRAVSLSAQMRPVAMPIVGSELARISELDRNNLIQLIVISFVSAARAKSVSRSLTVVVHPSDIEKVNMLELEAFVKGF